MPVCRSHLATARNGHHDRSFTSGTQSCHLAKRHLTKFTIGFNLVRDELTCDRQPWHQMPTSIGFPMPEGLSPAATHPRGRLQSIVSQADFCTNGWGNAPSKPLAHLLRPSWLSDFVRNESSSIPTPRTADVHTGCNKRQTTDCTRFQATRNAQPVHALHALEGRCAADRRAGQRSRNEAGHHNRSENNPHRGHA